MFQSKNSTGVFYILLYLLSMGLAIGIVLNYERIPIPLCPFKLLTGLPCPGCGGLRAASAFLHGDILTALYINPLSCVIIVFCALLPVIYIYDKYTRTEFIQKISTQPWPKWALYALFCVIGCNWIWNIMKGM